ncbi:uncharacterized protein MONOS_12766 [Monocercomonoides exilis]|uniref:uncharacterized protein n=1 Tax=Monocercomonoides exilis TaxID=2049356 RepID=UPI00355A9B67|nr:hypothetical protein MONOS_12766 [Monocercomonoides exilis]|eukprot:MONOS_12766.1-p1 / transcript=MONOS_12766.1 / gene=MONOS_12766 / organism=Monocercomonoides_exilis_PA203 / gene_product=unspecified product / transcript_product=unspecified product / location=Mono_scaffold00730:29550-29822(-) / protein_length=91 / sequence_SO=supercontig / SO=protein_coding / is_pseudo=false
MSQEKGKKKEKEKEEGKASPTSSSLCQAIASRNYITSCPFPSSTPKADWPTHLVRSAAAAPRAAPASTLRFSPAPADTTESACILSSSAG